MLAMGTQAQSLFTCEECDMCNFHLESIVCWHPRKPPSYMLPMPSQHSVQHWAAGLRTSKQLEEGPSESDTIDDVNCRSDHHACHNTTKQGKRSQKVWQHTMAALKRIAEQHTIQEPFLHDAARRGPVQMCELDST
jgi:hypothetical protein